jgi:hypothetical protein
MRYINHYECPCGEQWIDEWDCACNDKCPACNKEIEPHHSEDTYESMSLAELLRRHDTGAGAPADTVERAATLLEDIHRLVDGVEWDSTTTSDLCDLLTAEGFEIRDVGNEDDEPTGLYEILGYGFDGGTDETDDRVIWVSGSIEDVRAVIEGTKARKAETLPDNYSHAIDYRLPEDAEELKARLLSYEDSSS